MCFCVGVGLSLATLELVMLILMIVNSRSEGNEFAKCFGRKFDDFVLDCFL